MLAVIWSLIEPFIGYIAAAVAALGVFLAAQAKAKRDGRKQERQKQKEQDRENADAIRRRVDDARRVPSDNRFRD
jgi:Flp pilus assembly protein TadB